MLTIVRVYAICVDALQKSHARFVGDSSGAEML